MPVFFSLRASDGDGDAIIFAFADNTDDKITEKFRLDEDSGVISLLKQLDVETVELAGPYNFQVLQHMAIACSMWFSCNIRMVCIRYTCELHVIFMMCTSSLHVIHI